MLGAASLSTMGAVEQQPDNSRLQYRGFEQTGNIRAYRFARISRGEQTREYTVSADLALFAKHHVRIQEGPAMSLGHLRLSAYADSSGAPGWVLTQWLTDADMLAHLASRPAPAKAPPWGQRRTPGPRP